MLELLEVVQHVASVEGADVVRLCRRQTSHRPTEMHEMRLDGMRQRMHSDLLGETIAFARIARTACRDHVRPIVCPAPRERNEMVAGERLSRLELRHVTAAVLTAVVIAREEKRVGDLATEAARHVDELRQPDDCGSRQRQSLGANDTIGVGFDDLGFAVYDQTKSTPHRNHRQRLIGRVQGQTTNDHAYLRLGGTGGACIRTTATPSGGSGNDGWRHAPERASGTYRKIVQLPRYAGARRRTRQHQTGTWSSPPAASQSRRASADA